MTTPSSVPSRILPLALIAVALLAGCSAKTDDASSNEAAPVHAEATPTAAQPPKTPGLMEVFNLASGSSGNGAAMRELKSISGTLRETHVKYDVYDMDSRADPKTLSQNIQASLDSDRWVLIDTDGTPESRAKAAEILKEAVGGSLPDMTAVVVRKAPEEHGGGFGLIPIYTQADAPRQSTQGGEANSENANNTVANFFFEPPQKQP